MRASLRIPFFLWLFLLISWSFYRGLFSFPQSIDEFLVKPILWVGAIILVVKFVEERSLTTIGWSKDHLFENLYIGWGLGALFALEGVFTNAFKYRGFLFVPLGISFFDLLKMVLASFITGFSEETVFRGYLFTRVRDVSRSELVANLLSAGAFALIHLPIAYFVLHYEGGTVFSYMLILFLLGIANGFVFSRTKTIVAPTVSYALWNLSVILFR